MCLAIPGKIKEIKNKTAVIDYSGETREAGLLSDEFKVGDYVLVSGGFVMQKVSEDEALKIIAEWDKSDS